MKSLKLWIQSFISLRQDRVKTCSSPRRELSPETWNTSPQVKRGKHPGEPEGTSLTTCTEHCGPVNRTERVRWIYQLMGQWEASGQDLGVWAGERADVGVGWTGGGQVCEVAPVRSEKNTDKKSLTSNSDILTTYKLIQMKHLSKTLNASNRK